jgi:type IV pilus assembly protein PilE
MRYRTLLLDRVFRCAPCADRARAPRGFSLIELMVALAVVAILASVAFPSYLAYVRTSSRTEAQSLITDAATRQQQWLVDRRAYATTMTQLGVSVPADLASKYTFAIATADGPPPTYTFTATAIGDQTKDKCPAMTIDNTGNRTPSTCW